MRTQTIAFALTSVAACFLASFAQGSTVDAGTLTTVTVKGHPYDTRLGHDGGCDPAGCTGDLTRDGDWKSPESRWSCKGDLGASCTLAFHFADSLLVKGLKVAMHKGDTRTRSFTIYVDDATYYWTSSGTTLSFETIVFPETHAKHVELYSTAHDSDWVSILEVEILVESNVSNDYVEAGTLGTVTTSSKTPYDLDECSKEGCTPWLTRDGSLAPDSRWSCQSSGSYDSCHIKFDLGYFYYLHELRLAFYKGTERKRSVTVYVDGKQVLVWESSGNTNGFESIDMSGYAGQVIEIYGNLDYEEWLSITEVEILVPSQTGH